jgi:hypothetical protein
VVADHEVWQREDMRAALAGHQIASVYRILQRYGISQRRIAAATGQSQSEVSEIIGGRRVVAYDVLLRISKGLQLPRGYLGLAYDDSSERFAPPAPAREQAGLLFPAEHSCPSCGHGDGFRRRAVDVDGRVDADVVAAGRVADVGHVAATGALGPVETDPHQ